MSIVRVRPEWPEKNKQECPVCKAGRRDPCRAKVTGRVLYKTHTTLAKQRRAQKK